MNKLKFWYWRFIVSTINPIKYARHIGVKIGRNCFVDTRNWPSEPFLITIGDNCQITHCVSMYTHGGGQCIRDQYPDWDCFGKIVIEDWVYIGAYSQIMPGVTVGHHSLVAAGSVVTKSVPPYSVVGGNPARYICTTDEYYERNKNFDTGIHQKKLSEEEKKSFLLSLPETMFLKK